MTGGLADGLLAGARAHPDAVAVRHAGRGLTYAELDRASALVAGGLDGVRPGDRVGLFLDRSPDAVVAIHAVLRAGAAYVPLDPGSPPGRNAWILANAGATVLVASREWKARLRPLLAAAPGLSVRLVEDAREAGGAAGVPVSVDPEQPACLLYTSGSTGRPKGVAVSHRAALAFARWAAATFDLRPGDRVSGVSPLQFDLSTFEIFAALAGGATISIAPRGVSAFPASLGQFLDEEGVTAWYSVPSVLVRLLDGGLEGRAFAALDRVLFAGEPFPPARLAALMRRLPGARYANLFGPTETNVCTWHPVDAPPHGPVPIGRAACGDELRVADAQGADADEGELWVRGPSVMSAYWGDADATAAAFVEHGGHRWYRTRDRVRRDEHGCFHYLGRLDTMLKVRGFRVQPEAVEAVLGRHADVAEALVDALPDEAAGNRLRARVVAKPGCTPDPRRVRAFVAAELPAYLVPEVIELAAFLPRNDRGKLVRT